MRSLNIYTYATTAVVSLSYFAPDAWHAACAVGVALIGLITVPVAERLRTRACDKAKLEAANDTLTELASHAKAARQVRQSLLSRQAGD